VAGLALMTVCVYYCYGPYDSPYCSSGGSRSCSEDHVPILTRVLLSSNNALMNAAAGVGCLGYGRVPEVGKPRSRPGGQDQRLGWVNEVLSQGFPRVTLVLRFKVQGSGKDSTGSDLSREPV